jgi:tRNA/tmRNA/rRNA uracil-C5-methylase (TrmA/RlmC/RlmD family)
MDHSIRRVDHPVQSIELQPGCQIQCPGCAHRGWALVRSENQKQSWLSTKLNPWVNQIERIRSPKNQYRWNYRNKTCLHAKWDGKKWIFGLLKKDPKNWRAQPEIVDLSSCPVHTESVRKAVQILSELLPEPSVFPLVFLSISGSLLTFVLKSKAQPEVPVLPWESLGFTGVFFNLNPSAGNRVFSSRGWKLIWGEEYGVQAGEQGEFFYGPDSFQQLIPDLHQDALDEAEQYLNPGPLDGVIDLCSGVGRSLSLWKSRGAHTLGVELNGEAIRCAEKKIGKEICLRGRASERIPQLTKWIADKNPVCLSIYANPPRLGLEPEVTQWITHIARPKKLAYLSCSAGTLARDLSILSNSGYLVRRIIPYDFFPQTHHVETLALLVREE